MSEDAPRDRIELTSWMLLALSTVASAWCAYQASRWNGEQIGHLARASVRQFAASRKTAIANRDLTIDVSTFLQYVAADLHDDRKVADYLRAHARPELKAALDGWVADRASGRSSLATPFQRAEYKVRAQQEAVALDEQARRDLDVASDANRQNDLYVLHTVFFALALFFFGATSEVRRGGMRRFSLAFGLIILGVSLASLARLPRAPPVFAPRERPSAAPGGSAGHAQEGEERR